MPIREYSSFDGIALAELVRKGDVTPVELLEEAISRVEKLNPKLNAVVFKAYDQARAAAKEKRAGSKAPFEGVPLLLKDILAECAGMPNRSGSRFVPDTPGFADAELVTRYKRAGFIPFGKTNAPEFGILPITEPDLYGPARNPWNLDHTPGGSSGGSAAAVAAGILPIAHGNDGGGSIRIPSACCGLVGLKPTRGRNSTAPVPTDVAGGLVCDHVLTRTVRDTAAVLDATCGNIPGDPYTPAAPTGRFLDAVKDSPKGLKIAFWTKGFMGETINPEHEEGARNAAKLCASLGHHVEEDAPMREFSSIAPHFLKIYTCEIAFGIDATAFLTGRQPNRELVEGLTWSLYEMGKSISAPDYLLSQAILQLFTWEAAKFFEKYDLWLTPTLAIPPVKIGAVDRQNAIPGLMAENVAGLAHLNPIYNITGLPAISLPLYNSKAGLPIGICYGAKAGAEALLLRIAGQLEQALPWANRKPPLYG
ncbi:MAG: amidase [Candidatus Binataceae bacterium]